jgi:hypothetical protein
MGCWDILAPMETHIAIPHIVSDDPQNVRSFCARVLRDAENEER